MTGAAPPTGPVWVVPVVVAGSLLMDLMDTSALAMALPTLATAFAVEPVHMKLALTAYLMTVAVFVPASAWLSGRLGAKRVFIGAMALFMCGSVLCGAAQSLEQLVGARVLQGVGGAMMTPVGRSLAVASAPRSELVQAMGWFTMPAIIGPLLGPPLAGLLIEQADWRWIFYINIPIGIAGIVATVRYVPDMPCEAQQRFDFSGFVQIGACLALLLTAEGATLLTVPWRCGLAAAGLLAGWMYARHSRRVANPIVDLRPLRHMTLQASLLVGSLFRLSAGAVPFLLPLLLQVGMGISPFATSGVTIIMALGSLSARFTVPWLSRKLGFRSAMLWLAVGCVLMGIVPAFFTLATSLVIIAIVMAVASAFRSSLLITSTTIAYADVSRGQIGHASVLLAMSQQLSLGIGVSIAAASLSLASGDAPLQPRHFALPFVTIAALGVLGIAFILRMRPDAAAALRSRGRS